MARNGKNREEKEKFWNEFWDVIQKATSETEEHIDKKVFAVSSGAIALELTILQFLDKGTACCICLAKWAAALNILALALNIAVQLIGHCFQHRQETMVESFLSDKNIEDDNNIHKAIKRHNNWLFALNIASVVFLFAGLVMLSWFTLTNI